jgi:hypothetical protein
VQHTVTSILALCFLLHSTAHTQSTSLFTAHAYGAHTQCIASCGCLARCCPPAPPTHREDAAIQGDFPESDDEADPLGLLSWPLNQGATAAAAAVGSSSGGGGAAPVTSAGGLGGSAARGGSDRGAPVGSELGEWGVGAAGAAAGPPVAAGGHGRHHARSFSSEKILQDFQRISMAAGSAIGTATVSGAGLWVWVGAAPCRTLNPVS